MKSSRFQCISRAREEWLVVDGGVGVDGRNALLPKNHPGLYIYIHRISGKKSKEFKT